MNTSTVQYHLAVNMTLAEFIILFFIQVIHILFPFQLFVLFSWLVSELQMPVYGISLY